MKFRLSFGSSMYGLESVDFEGTRDQAERQAAWLADTSGRDQFSPSDFDIDDSSDGYEWAEEYDELVEDDLVWRIEEMV